MQATTTKPTTPTRRSAIGFSLAAFAAGLTVPILASASPTEGVGESPTLGVDAELIALCAEFQRVHTEWYANPNEFSDEWEEIGYRRSAVTDRIVNIAAKSDAGRVAKARVALTVLHEQEPHPDRRDSLIAIVYAALLDIAGSVAA
jgi:hypothetical protein